MSGRDYMKGEERVLDEGSRGGTVSAVVFDGLGDEAAKMHRRSSGIGLGMGWGDNSVALILKEKD